MIFMLENNNRRIICRMAKSSVKKNSGRNWILFLAILLASFMLFSIFTVGITYFKMYRIQNIRLNGGDYDAVLYGITEEQREKCEADPEISRAGIVALSGYIESTEGDDTVEASCIWADSVYWDEIMSPAREWVRGAYPEKENEVMATEEGLEKAGLSGLGIGDTFTAGYRDGNGRLQNREFTISGLWDGYGVKSAFYVSEAFYRASGCDISEVMCGRYHLKFDKPIMTFGEQNDFIESLNLGKQQALYFTGNMGYSLPIFCGLCGLVLVTCLCAYLLIYNIMYLSVAGNVRYYGLLQTVGMTGRQIRSLIRRQMLFLGGAGTGGGILLGGIVSFLLLPSVIRSLGIRTGMAGKVEVSLNPWVLLLTVALAAFTICTGSRKPAKLAAGISPVEAAGYRGTSADHAGYRAHRIRIRGRSRSGKQSQNRGMKQSRNGDHGRSQSAGRGGILVRLALDQIRKDKRKAAVIMVSLAAGMSVFLCVTTLLESQGARTIVTNHMDNDLTIVNDTLKKEDAKEHKDLLTESFLDDLKSVSGVAEIYPLSYGQITVPWEPDFAEMWMEETYAKWMNIPYEKEREEYKEHPENFGAVMIGISEEEFPYLQQTVETEIDREDFLEGKTCVIYRNDLDLTSEEVVGKDVTCGEYGNGDNQRTFRIAGMTDEGYYMGPMLGLPPTVIVSDRTLEGFLENHFVAKVGVNYAETYNEETENGVLRLIKENPEADGFSWESKLESMKEVESAQGNMKEVGTGISLILALIGILNYVNTVTGNIQSRKTELAILESVGMTDRQRNRMLVTEGLIFAVGSLLITATAGLAVTYAVYQSMNYMQVPFVVPVWPAAGMAVFIAAVCAGIPVIAGAGMVHKGSVVERVRGV